MLVLMTILGFIFMLGLLIAIHEFGHFVMAKLFGVRVDLFSLGFVGKIVGFRWGETYYKIGWLPLGGYVKMLGQEDELDLPIDLQHRSFSHKPLWQRSIIILAGPLANLILLPMLIYLVLFLTYTTDFSTVIGTILPDMPAARVGLRAGDRIDAVNGVKTRYFRELLQLIGHSKTKKLRLKVHRKNKDFFVDIIPKQYEEKDIFGDKKKRGIIGIYADFRRSEVGISDTSSPAYKAGLRTWDRIVEVDGHPIQRWEELVHYRMKQSHLSHRYKVIRPMLFDGLIFHNEVMLKPRIITVHPIVKKGENGKKYYYDGILSSELFVRVVRKGTPLEKIGLQVGDRLIELGGKKLKTVSDLSSLPDKVGREYLIVFERKSQIYKRKFKLYSMSWRDEFNNKHEEVILGVLLSEPYQKGILVSINNRFSYAWMRAWDRVWQLAGLIVRVIKKMFTREISTDNIGSPIMIFQVTKNAIEQGWDVFWDRLAMISINLGLINLLPIPLLDGGHLFFFLIEGVIRRPVPRRVKESALVLGLILLLFVLILAVKNDIQRLFF